MISLFALAGIAIWMCINRKKKFVWMPLIPAAFYAFVTSSFILNAKIGFNLPWPAAYGIAAAFTVVYLIVILWGGNKKAAQRATA